MLDSVAQLWTCEDVFLRLFFKSTVPCCCQLRDTGGSEHEEISISVNPVATKDTMNGTGVPWAARRSPEKASSSETVDAFNGLPADHSSSSSYSLKKTQTHWQNKSESQRV